MYHYVYRLDHIETGEFYIGSRSSKYHPTMDKYMGSMVSWKPDKSKLIKKIIKDDFKNREGAIKYEAELITENINDSLNRNFHIPGKGFHTVGLTTVKDLSGNTFNVLVDDPRYLSGELVPIWTNRKHSVETKNKIGIKNSKNQRGDKNSQFGTCWITDGSNNKKIKITAEIPNGWSKGRTVNNAEIV